MWWIKNFLDVEKEVKKEKPHLILLDIKLPRESGFVLCSKIRTFSNVPIIFVTSCNTDMDELNSIMLGGDAFITKPYNTAILLAKIETCVYKFSNGTNWLRRHDFAFGSKFFGI